MNGFIVVDKPEGITSHDVVHKVRKILATKKAGHTGTLDPFATGVLPVALGEATKAIPFLDETTKEYSAVMRLGATTDTQDCTGKVLREYSHDHVTEDILEDAMSRFIGTIKQIPPMFSALKCSGVPLYKLARQGHDIPREPREITIYSLTLEKINLPEVYFMVRCSRGTYVRTLANDLGEMLGCGAHLSGLRRTASGIFTVKDAVSIETLTLLKDEGQVDDYIISPHCSLSHFKDVELTDKGACMVKNGALPDKDGFQSLPSVGLQVGEKFTLSYCESLLAVAESVLFPWSEGSRNLRLLRVFN
jgi:tRNA pseudouridine55 synthase